MRCEYLIPARGSSIDNMENSLSIFAIIDQITIAVPAQITEIPFGFQIVCSLVREPNDPPEIHGQAQAKIYTPGGELALQTPPIAVALAADKNRIRLRMGINIPVRNGGEYRVVLEGPYNATGEITFTIVMNPPVVPR